MTHDSLGKSNVSVVIPAYNAGAYLCRAVESVLAQTLPVTEIIVVDDGSTDNTSDVARDFGDQIKYIYQENAGASVARNTGVKVANCEWIAFLDGDDEWLPDKNELQFELLEQNPELKWVTGNFIRVDTKTGKICDDLSGDKLEHAKQAIDSKVFFEDFYQAFLNNCIGCTNCFIIRKSFLLSVGVFNADLPRYNDYDMWFRLACEKQPLGYVFKPSSKYYINLEGSIVQKNTSIGHMMKFVDSQSEYAQRCGVKIEFDRCAAMIVSHVINVQIASNQGSDARVLLRKYSHLLNKNFAVRKYIRSISPVISNGIIKLLSKVKGGLWEK